MAGAQPEIQATHSFAGSAHVNLHWIPALGGPQPLFGRAGASPGSFDERLYVLRYIDDAQLPPAEVQLIREYHVRYVFYGAGLRAGARWHLNLARLLVDPRPCLVYTSATTCRAGARVTRVMCPMTASYVFHVTEANRSTVKKDVKIL
jgi:hypothetical protein